MRYPVLLSLIVFLVSALILQWTTNFPFKAEENVGDKVKPSHATSANMQATGGKTIQVDNAARIIMRPMTDYAAILERPIFFPNRRFPKPKPQKPKKVRPAIVRKSSPKPRVSPPFNGKVHGIVMSDEMQKVLLSKSGGQPEWFQLNDKVDGWKIEKVQSGSVVLSQGGFTKRLELHAVSR